MRNILLRIAALTLLFILSGASHPYGAFAYPFPNLSRQGRLDTKENDSPTNLDGVQEQQRPPQPQPSIPPSPTPKSLTDSIADNPASLLGMIGAIVAALVALISFIFNYRATLQGQRDTQFYEALKRFGDKDSPTTRASAAGLLALLGPKRSILRLSGRPYLGIALDQLITALLLEKESVVLTSISDALRQLVSHDRHWASERAYFVNTRLREDLVESLAEYFIANGITSPDGISKELWAKAAFITDFEQSVLSSLTDQVSFRLSAHLGLVLKGEDTTIGGISTEEKLIETKKKAQRLKASSETLKVVATRLRHNVSVCSTLLSEPFNTFSVIYKGIDPSERAIVRNLPKLYWRLFTTPKTSMLAVLQSYKFYRIKAKLRARGINSIDNDYLIDKVKVFGVYNNIFLPKASFKYADMSWLFLTGAQLQEAIFAGADLWHVNLKAAQMGNVDFSSATLSKVDLQGASLLKSTFEKAKFNSVDLKDAKLGGIKVDDKISIKNTAWWLADFFETDGRTVDHATLETLYNKSDKTALDSINVAHDSVLDFFKSKGITLQPKPSRSKKQKKKNG